MHLIEERCRGSSIPATIMYPTTALYVMFHTDGSVTYPGFTLHYNSCEWLGLNY